MAMGNGTDSHTGANTTSVVATVGYKRPPRGSRFNKGRSGNSKGRPKGRPNFAEITRDLFNAKTKIRVGEQTLYMPTGEAIIRKLMVDATRGNHRSLMALLDIIEMTGRTNEVSDEERERRTLKLPKPKSRDEFDLIASPARAKERQRLFLTYQDAEAKGSAPEGDPDRIGRHEGTYRSFVAQMNPGRAIMPEPSPEAIRIGLEADQRLYAGDFAGAVRLADDATAKSLDCEATWMRLILAHARMFSGQAPESNAYYLSFQTPKNISLTSWETVILQDFEKLRKAGHSHPLMSEIAKHFTDQGWTLKAGAPMRPKPLTITIEDRAFIVLNPDDLKTGDLLERDGEFDKAASLYRRSIAKCRSRLANNKSDADARQTLKTAAGRLMRLAWELVLAGRLGQASEFIEELLVDGSGSLGLQALRAHLLMSSGQGREARAIFLQHRGKTVGTDSWETVILKDFDTLRTAGRAHVLMDEIEQLFGSGSDAVSLQRPEPAPPAVSELDELAEASDVASGDKLFEQRRFSEALAVYLRYLDQWNFILSRTPNKINTTAIAYRDRAVDRICDLAVIMIQNREYKAACEAAGRALAAKQQAPRANITIAHGLMLLGQVDEARVLYEKCRRERLDAERKAADVILEDFAAIREAGLTHPLMDEIENLIALPEPRRLVR